MCGITGIVYKDTARQVHVKELQRANNTLTHRGPDDAGYHIDRNVGIAMRRLSIIDIAGGHQPIANETKDIHIVYNGEVYNHQHLRSTLISAGHRFQTRSDTESILHAYEEYGTELFSRLNGMFAFAIWDSRIREMLIARDRMGIKPLFLYEDDEKYIFASEIKAILAFPHVKTDLWHEALYDYLTLNYIPAPKTIYRHIRKVPPGVYVRLAPQRSRQQKYWDFAYRERALSLPSATQQLQDLLTDAIRIRLMSEVPLGAFLSGGIDSSTISYFITKNHLKDELHSFSIGFETDSKYNELPFSATVARQIQTQHHTEVVQPDMVAMLPEVIRMLDEPMSDPSVIPTYMLSRFTRKFVTVALSGDGGDELFAGYERQKVFNILKRFYALPKILQKCILNTLAPKRSAIEQKDTLFASVRRVLRDIHNGYQPTYERWITNLNTQLLGRLLTTEMTADYQNYNVYQIVNDCFSLAENPINQSLGFETRYYLPDDLLVKVDRMSMAHSLEVRVPFLDHRLVEFAVSLPVHLKIQRGKTKFLLKHMMKPYLPRKIITKPKQGFSPPIKEWLRAELKEFCLDTLLADPLSGYVQKAALQKLLHEHYSNERDYQYQIWSLLVLAVWLGNR